MEEMVDIEKHYASLEFPECLGSVDCAIWKWEKCPVDWQGLYKGKEKSPGCRREVVCNDFLRIYHVMFGAPGAKNDLRILQQSKHYNAIRTGNWLPVNPNMCVSALVVSWFYCLADGIYPAYRIFETPLRNARRRKELLYSRHHSAAQKGVERLVGVPFRRFRILDVPCRLWDLAEMANVVTGCAIIHNIVCQHGKRKYAGTTNVKAFEEEPLELLPTEMGLRKPIPECSYEQGEFWRQHANPIEDPAQHRALQKELLDHIWK